MQPPQSLSQWILGEKRISSLWDGPAKKEGTKKERLVFVMEEKVIDKAAAGQREGRERKRAESPVGHPEADPQTASSGGKRGYVSALLSRQEESRLVLSALC